MVFNNKKYGFTLAELLLTISMIGVLATLTISTIGYSVQQRARLSEFRAAYARLDAALRNVTIDEGKIYRCYLVPSAAEITEFGLTGKIETGTAQVTNDCAILDDIFAKAMGATKKCDTNPLGNNCIPANYPVISGSCFQNSTTGRAYVLDNGMILWTNSGSYYGLQNFAIDINGRSAPNKWGQDLFAFSVKVTESKKIGNKIFPKTLGILPPACQPTVSSAGKTTAQMMRESNNKK